MLGLERGASRDEVVAAYRRLVKKVHPDQGGSAYLTRRLTEARDVLLGGR
ncbi:MAG: J domain-containing protein [Deltaproteobacteria bacterium]|nr:J domain-containing protein [Deltaproteobacteria bacterium]